MTLEPTEFATETQLWNAIVRQFGRPLPLPSGHVVLDAADPPDGAWPVFRLGVGRDVPLTLALQDFPFEKVTGVDLRLGEIMALPAPLADGLLLAAVEALRSAMPPALAAQIKMPAAPGAGHAGDAPDCWLSVALDLGGGAVAQGRLGGRQRDFVQLLAQIYPQAGALGAKLPAALLDGLSAEIALSIAERRFPLATIRALQPGDVLLADIRANRRSFQIGGRDVVIGSETATDSAVAPTTGGPDSGRPDSGWTVKEIGMTGETTEAPNPLQSEAASLEEMPVTLRFVTEDRRIPLADLQNLATGALLPIDATPLAAGLAVRIQANGVTIGDGHLVLIDDRYAVRVARIAARAS